MDRLEIALPETFPFEIRLDVRIGDVNYGGHLGNDRLLGLLQEARLGWLATWGCSEQDAEGVGLIMTEAEVQYRAQAFHGDPLRIGVAADAVGRTGFRLLYGVTHAESGREVARARTALACYDYARGRVARLPDALRKRLG